MVLPEYRTKWSTHLILVWVVGWIHPLLVIDEINTAQLPLTFLSTILWSTHLILVWVVGWIHPLLVIDEINTAQLPSTFLTTIFEC
jgi:hypothetical protein